jgi:potassium efflux system protein
LSYLLRLTFLLCSCFGLLLYTSIRTITTLFAAMLRLPRLRSLASVRLHEHAMVRWAERVMKVSAAFCWLYVTLNLLEVKEPVRRTLVSVLNARLGIRAFDFSLGDVLGFVSVLIVGYLIASGCRFVLREEILRHWRLSRGVPETISTSLHYMLLLLVFLMSLSAGGIELDKLTVLTGALGVGLGFGLQNIVNNFVSGLILQFERPIRVGDILEIGTLSGEVRRIGIRASTMRTAQGSEVIVPNSTFISGQVVNWTLSEPVRRVDVPVHVAYGTDPERVIKMLLEIAVSNSEVLRRPEPSAVFMGFGESSLQFLLMFWADQDTHFRLRSDVSIRINVALREQGIEIPLPQREIRVHSSESLPTFRQSASLRGWSENRG